MTYKRPNLVGTEGLDRIDAEEIYVGACFMGSGRQNYVVQHGK
jgi:hypothetical protein